MRLFSALHDICNIYTIIRAYIESILDIIAQTTFDTYREVAPEFQFYAILDLLLLTSSIIALGILHVLLISVVRKTTSVNDNFNTYVNCK
jgi:hypothetical protein